MTDEYISDDGPGSDLFDPYETGWWKTAPDESSVDPNQTCPKCNGEGYVVVRVYPWDGCSYDEEPCKFCNPRMDCSELDDELLDEMDIPF